MAAVELSLPTPSLSVELSCNLARTWLSNIPGQHVSCLLIGSRAANFNKPGVLQRTLDVADWDIVASPSWASKFIDDNMSRIVSIEVKLYSLAGVSPQPRLGKFLIVYKYVPLDPEEHNECAGVQRLEIEITNTFVKEDGDVSVATTANKLFQLPEYQTLPKTIIPGFTFNRGTPFMIRVAPLDWLLALKESHIFHAVNWPKHISDLHRLRTAVGAPLSPVLQEFVQARRAETNARLGEPGSRLNLKQSNIQFLDGARTSLSGDDAPLIPHERLHELVAYGGRPAFEGMKRDSSLALMDRDLFEAAPLEQRLACVREEAMSLALERYLLDDPENNVELAYARALQKVCTELTKGYFRQFAVDHWPLVKDLDRDLWELVRPEYEVAKEKRLAERTEQRRRQQQHAEEELAKLLAEEEEGTKGFSIRAPAEITSKKPSVTLTNRTTQGLPDDVVCYIAQFCHLSAYAALLRLSKRVNAAIKSIRNVAPSIAIGSDVAAVALEWAMSLAKLRKLAGGHTFLDATLPPVLPRDFTEDITHSAFDRFYPIQRQRHGIKIVGLLRDFDSYEDNYDEPAHHYPDPQLHYRAHQEAALGVSADAAATDSTADSALFLSHDSDSENFRGVVVFNHPDQDALPQAARQFVRDQAVLLKIDAQSVVARCALLTAAESSFPPLEDLATMDAVVDHAGFHRTRHFTVYGLLLGRTATFHFEESRCVFCQNTCGLIKRTDQYEMTLTAMCETLTEPVYVLQVVTSVAYGESWGDQPPNIIAGRFGEVLSYLGMDEVVTEMACKRIRIQTQEFVQQLLHLCAPRFAQVPGSREAADSVKASGRNILAAIWEKKVTA